MKYTHNQPQYEHHYFSLAFWTIIFTLDIMLFYALAWNDSEILIELLM